MDNFFKRFFAEVSDLDHIFLGSVGKIFYGIDSRSLQAVEASYGHIEFFDSHFEYLFLDLLFALYHDFGIHSLVRELDEEVEVLVKNLCCERYSFLSIDGTVGGNVELELVIVGDVADTGVRNSEISFENRGEDRIGIDSADYRVFNRGLVLDRKSVV